MLPPTVVVTEAVLSLLSAYWAWLSILKRWWAIDFGDLDREAGNEFMGTEAMVLLPSKGGQLYWQQHSRFRLLCYWWDGKDEQSNYGLQLWLVCSFKQSACRGHIQIHYWGISSKICTFFHVLTM